MVDQRAPDRHALDRFAWCVEDGRVDQLDDDSDAASAAFGRRLRALRAKHGVSQDELARLTDVHSTAIGRLERGKREPRLTTILKLARGLGVKPGELLDDLAKKI
jgi:DNA-binding XRE family transcriptional regulator